MSYNFNLIVLYVFYSIIQVFSTFSDKFSAILTTGSGSKRSPIMQIHRSTSLFKNLRISTGGSLQLGSPPPPQLFSTPGTHTSEPLLCWASLLHGKRLPPAPHRARAALVQGQKDRHRRCRSGALRVFPACPRVQCSSSSSIRGLGNGGRAEASHGPFRVMTERVQTQNGRTSGNRAPAPQPP